MRQAVRGLTLALAFAGPASAAEDPALFPAAQCAALWFGQDDYAQVSAWLDRDPKDLALAEAFAATFGDSRTMIYAVTAEGRSAHIKNA
jgi:hypothetical protein